jgi:hypothetical protein
MGSLVEHGEIAVSRRRRIAGPTVAEARPTPAGFFMSPDIEHVGSRAVSCQFSVLKHHNLTMLDAGHVAA